MASGTVGRVLGRVFQDGTVCGLTEGELLRRFVAQRDEAAFEALVVRHGPMVLGVCRRMLGDPHAAADAFQATFLTLVRKAGGLRDPDQIGPWLHGVAFKIAARARVDAARRVQQEQRQQRTGAADAGAGSSLDLAELRGLLDEELQRLPDKYRKPILLCYVDGLSQEEAAHRLRCTSGSLRGRLDRGREKLRARLILRGAAPSAVIAATAFHPGVILAAVSEPLKAAVLRTVTARATAGAASASVLALAGAGYQSTPSSLIKLAGVLMGLGGVILAAASPRAFSDRDGAAAGPPIIPPQAAARPKPLEQPSATDEAKEQTWEVLRVVDPDDRPVAGAKLYMSPSPQSFRREPIAPTSLGETGPDGSFRHAPERQPKDSPFQAQIYATAEGFAPGFVSPTDDGDGDKIIRLVKDDVPIQGRVLDIQGRPVAGATVGVVRILRPHPSESLDPWLKALQKEGAAFPAEEQTMLPWETDDVAYLFPPVVADQEGRFTIRGVGRERIASLLVAGPGIATTFEYVATREMPTFKIPDWTRQHYSRDLTYYGAEFDLVIGPGLTAVGRVTDKDDGRPLAGVRVGTTTFFGIPLRRLWTTTDADGRYTLESIPPKTQFNGEQDLLAEFEDESYLPTIQRLGTPEGSKPIAMDFQIKRGVRVEGQVVDESTGEGRRAQLSYYILADNPNLKNYPLYGTVWAGMPIQTNDDGRFETVVMPGPGILGARAGDDHYRLGKGVDSIPQRVATRPNSLIPHNYHTLFGFDAKPGDDPMTCRIGLDRGRSVKGKVVGPDGEPLAGARIEGLQDYFRVWPHEPLESAEFLVQGIAKGASRDLLAIHEEKNLAGAFVIGPEEAGPITLALQPYGIMIGRLVDAGGRPLAEIELDCFSLDDDVNYESGSLPDGLKTDAEGRFRAEGLVPGRKYRLSTWRLGPDSNRNRLVDVAKDVVADAGETRDLGDLIVQDSE